MGLVVRKPGMLTTVQDLGRFGHQASGFATNGVMDHRAATIANILVENSPKDCVLEFALAGPSIRFTTDTIIALTGADFMPTINNKPVDCYSAIPVKPGSILKLKAPRDGIYGYLAIAGGSLKVPRIMKSCSTNLKCSIGGWKGRILETGDYLPFTTDSVEFLPNLASHKIEPDHIYEFDKDEIHIRVVLGPQTDMFTERGIATFLTESYTTTSQCDRMGYRLEGPEVETISGSDIISDGIAFGAIQIPSHGKPIVMLADRQTTGGYAKIGTIASVDIPKLVQCKAGKRIYFDQITVQEAQELVRHQAKWYAGLTTKVKRMSANSISPRRTARRLTPILEKQAQISAGEKLWINR